jgi:cellobiose-specific phosphotransferase system component IIA
LFDTIKKHLRVLFNEYFYWKVKLDINKCMNKYTQWYTAIIENARDRILSGYKESHHIVPQSLGGPDTKENLVNLTAREHFICHWLLVKIHSGEARAKMVYALNGMKRTNKEQERYETAITSRVYQKLKEEFGKTHSAYMKGRQAHNKGKPMSEEQKAKIRATKAANPTKRSAEAIAKTVAKQKGQKRSEETKLKMSLAAKGKLKGPMSEDEKLKRSLANKGKPKSAEHTAKKAETLKRLVAEGKHHSQIKLTCPHCGVTMQKILYARWHGDRCRTPVS